MIIKEKITKPEQVKTIWESTIVNEKWHNPNKEAFVVFLLNNQNRVIDWELVSLGTVNCTIVHPRDVFRLAIQKSATSIVIAHNHPSGETVPSNEDLKVTRQLIEAGKIIDIKVLDHVIIGDEFNSLRDSGLCYFC